MPLVPAGARRKIARAAALIATAIVAAAAGPATTTAPATSPAIAAATRPALPAAFDSARHMRVDEVRVGMTGHGLTVLSGTTISRFPVEVIGVLHHVFGPGQSVVMIRCTDEFMRRTGPIAGCSGSPIYLRDDQGRDRLIGAYALGWDLAKEPIVGVQPIEYMLTLAKPPGDAVPPAISSATSTPRVALLAARTAFASPRPLATSPSQNKLRPLATPLAARGIGARAIDRLAPTFRAMGFEPLAVASGGGVDPTTLAAARIEPGSVMAGAMLTGDLELTALGTCTEVIDGRAYGFGHPFNGEGATSVPMGAGAVNLVMPTLASSFKMGAIGSVSGAIDMDGTFGVAGQIGAEAHTFPMAVTVTNAARTGTTGDAARTFNFRSAVHRMFSPMLVGAALQASLTADQQLPPEHTVRYEATIDFADGRSLAIRNVATSADEGDAARDVAWPVQMMMNNPFRNVMVKAIRATATVEAGVRATEILSVAPARDTYRPGETARLRVRTRKHGGDAVATRTIDVPLPATLADGDVTVLVSDAAGNLAAEAQATPYRFEVRSTDELFAGLEAIARSSDRMALYVRLAGLGDGVAIGQTPLPKLPPSRRALLQSAERPDLSATLTTALTVIPSDEAISGNATVTLHIKKKLP